MVDFLLVPLLYCQLELQVREISTHPVGIALADTLGDHLRITLLVAGISTVLALITLAGKEELLAERAHDGLVELLRDKLVAVHLVHVALPFPDGALTAESFVWSARARSGILDYNGQLTVAIVRRLTTHQSPISAR
jgi:hypothetical protein